MAVMRLQDRPQTLGSVGQGAASHLSDRATPKPRWLPAMVEGHRRQTVARRCLSYPHNDPVRLSVRSGSLQASRPVRCATACAARA